MVMFGNVVGVNGNVGQVCQSCETEVGSNNIEEGISIPTLPTLPSKDWCEKYDAVEDFSDNIQYCKICKIKMKKKKCMGGHAMYCDNYWKCGQRVKILEVNNGT